MVVKCLDAAGGWLAGNTSVLARRPGVRRVRATIRGSGLAGRTTMIQLAQLHKTFGDRILFDHVTWQIGDRERVGLCGPNGAGKTTLLRILAGIDEADSGQVVTPSGLTVGYLPQDGLGHRGRTLLDEASTAFADLLARKAEMHGLEARLGDDS